ncbi:MAG: hypothetical protein M1514_00885 [Patescibacteria group bacterium]|nr:hypothetical protein [Patescibacteria group bacterium]
MASKKSTFGLDKNMAAAATYLLGWLTGIIFFIVEKDDKDIRFHALQSIMFFGLINILGMVPFINVVLSPFLILIG